MVSIPNIYASKHVKYFIAIPLILLVAGAYFSTKIVLDYTLSGGVSVIVQTNATVSNQQIASYIASHLHSPQPNIERSTGGLQITISTNGSIAKAQSASLAFYSYYQNYTASLVNVTALTPVVGANSSNKTASQELSAAKVEESASLAKMNSSLATELAYLRPFIGNESVPSNPTAMAALATGAYANASSAYTNQIISTLHSAIPFTTYSYQSLGPTLGRYFLSQLEEVIIIAFILVSIAVLFIFRSVAPAFTIVFGAANDMIIALGAMGLIGIPLGTASIGGLLMIIGYSIDTDVLSAFRILKMHGGTPEERAYSSMKTGLTMTTTAIVSFGVLFAVAVLTYVPTYYEVAGVALFGLIGDIFTTWMGNAVIMLLYKKRKDGL